MLQAGGEGELDGRPWRLRLSGCCPRATVHSWFCRLVRPRRSDCAMIAMSLVCFISSLSLEAALLLRYEQHVMLVVASLVIAALLLASCCMGLLVWWKGPQWADDDRDAAAWVRDEHQPSRHRAPPQVCTARHDHKRRVVAVACLISLRPPPPATSHGRRGLRVRSRRGGYAIARPRHSIGGLRRGRVLRKEQSYSFVSAHQAVSGALTAWRVRSTTASWMNARL